ncbi:signal recognition particle-docking protein FtsY [bacterium]|nr:signal recognition particle-docking protein FtsY [bacterium]
MSEQPEQERKPRPGFFSRLFSQKKVEEAEAKAAAPIEDPSPVDYQDSIPTEPLEENIATEPLEPPVGNAPKKSGMLSWIWGSSKKKPASPDKPDPIPETVPEHAAPAPAAVPRKSWFERLRERLRSGSGSFLSAVWSAFGISGKLDEETTERLEEILLAADVGMETTLKIVKKLEARAKAEKAEGAERLMELFKEVLTEVFEGSTKTFSPQPTDGPYVVMVVGVNGVGKTTTIGKMAKRCRDAGLRVMLVAGDTFRAAAVEQLEVWARRTESDFLKAKHGADPSGLAFDALTAARARSVDVVFFDTAGRLQTKTSLMEELGKVHRVCGKVIGGAPHETLLVIDATTGQNAVNQVKAFSEAVKLNGLVMTKLDGTAKGGILITIRDQFDIPVTLIGVGEGVDDLRDFDPRQFANALFGAPKEEK